MLLEKVIGAIQCKVATPITEALGAEIVLYMPCDILQSEAKDVRKQRAS